MMLACSIVGVIPYINILIGFPIIWTIGVCLLQSSVNELAEMQERERLAAAAVTA